jgi:hypothetical protein
MSVGSRRWHLGMGDPRIAQCLRGRRKRYLGTRKAVVSLTTIRISKISTNGFNEIARRHDQNILAMLELVKLSE